MSASVRAAIARQLSRASGIPASIIEHHVDKSRQRHLADYAVAVPGLLRAANASGSLEHYTKTWLPELGKDDVIQSWSIAGPYLNVHIDRERFTRLVLQDVVHLGSNYGRNSIGNNELVLIEYSSPNIAKPFHAGHLRSTMLGNFLANIHKTSGYRTLRLNYLGDWGKQYGLLAVGYQMFGDDQALKNNPIRHLYEVYVRINALAKENPSIDSQARAYFARLETGGEQEVTLWQKFRDLSIEELKRVYNRLHVHFDVYDGESKVSYQEITNVINALITMGAAKSDKDKSIIADLEPHGLGRAVLRKADGSSLYLTRDLAAAISRIAQFSPGKMLYVVSDQQNHYFAQFRHLLKTLGHDWAENCVHVPFGMVHGMSTRSGNVVFLDDIINEAANRMLENMRRNEEKLRMVEDPEGVAEQIAHAAVVVQDFKARRIKPYDFSWDRMLAAEGDTGPYLQYSHARLMSIERHAPVALDVNIDVRHLLGPEAQALVDEIAAFPDTVLASISALEPRIIVGHAFRLAQTINAFHQSHYVQGQEQQIAQARLLLFHAARITLANSIKLLGVAPLSRM